MEIRAYTAAQLVELTNSPQYATLKHIPVSKLRAQSHLHNPRLEANTPMMYIAWLNGEVVGYRMVLCDQIFINNTPQPVGWYSCVWVDPSVRGKGIAKQLVKRCLDDWQGRIFGADAVPESRKLYLSTGLYQGGLYLEGTRAYLRAPFADVVLKKKPNLKPLKPLLALADWTVNLLVPTQAQPLPKGIEQVDRVDDEIAAFIQPYLQQQLFRRGKDELNWIAQYPWIRSGEPNEESRRYYFSSVAGQFKLLQWKLKDDKGKVVGYAMLSLRDGHLKTPYVYVEPNHLNTMAKAIMAVMVNEKLAMLTTFHPGLATYFKQHRKPYIFVKSIRREYFASLPVSPYVKTGPLPNICDGDGDQAFT